MTSVKFGKSLGGDDAVHFHSTPPPVAERMASLLAAALPEDAREIRLLDPGIGDGALSVAAVKALREANHDVAVTGIDLSTDLLAAAALNLTSPGASAALRKEDFLRESVVGGFDAAICNPPYGKRSQPELGERILLEYREAISGHPNLFALFIHKIIRSLRPGGVCVIICPKSLMSGPYFRGLRQFMREQGAIETLLLFDQRFGLFEGVLQGVFVFQFRRGAHQGPCKVKRVLGPAEEDSWVVETPYADARFGYRILPGSSATNRALLLKALSYPVTVAERFAVETGPLVWFRHKQRLIESRADGSDVPVVWSDQIEPGHITKGRKADRLRVVGRNTFALTQSKIGPALVTKRITAPEEDRRLVAGLTSQPMWSRPIIFENHTNVIRSRNRKIDDVVRLELLLGTRLYDDLLRALSHNTQVGAADLRILPFVRLPLATHERDMVLRSADGGADLRELVDLHAINNRLLEELSAADFCNPDESVHRDVVHLTLPLSEPTNASVDGRKAVDG